MSGYAPAVRRDIVAQHLFAEAGMVLAHLEFTRGIRPVVTAEDKQGVFSVQTWRGLHGPRRRSQRLPSGLFLVAMRIREKTPSRGWARIARQLRAADQEDARFTCHQHGENAARFRQLG